MEKYILTQDFLIASYYPPVPAVVKNLNLNLFDCPVLFGLWQVKLFIPSDFVNNFKPHFCDTAKVNYNKKMSITSLENQFLIKLIGDAMEKISAADRAEFVKMAGFNTAKMLTPEGMVAAAQAAFVAGGFQSYQITLMVVNAVSRALLGRGLTFAANSTLARTLGVVAGPIGWAVTGAWTAIDLAGPAFRVTLPAVIHVALLRKKHEAEKEGLWAEIEKELER